MRLAYIGNSKCPLIRLLPETKNTVTMPWHACILLHILSLIINYCLTLYIIYNSLRIDMISTSVYIFLLILGYSCMYSTSARCISANSYNNMTLCLHFHNNIIIVIHFVWKKWEKFLCVNILKIYSIELYS